MSSDKGLRLAGAILAVVIAAAIFVLILTTKTFSQRPEEMVVLIFACVLLFVAVTLVVGMALKKADIKVAGATVELEYFEQTQVLRTNPPRVLDDQTRARKESIATEARRRQPLPGDSAPRFSVIEANADDLLVRPSAYPMTPMYLLDNAFRILDWNEAFTVAFDRTMEGRKGRSVLEWTYFLDNYEDVLKHGQVAFGDSKRFRESMWSPSNTPASCMES